MARKFFKNFEVSAKILGIPAHLIENIGYIWTLLSCGFSIDTVKFGEFCNKWHEDFKASSVRKV